MRRGRRHATSKLRARYHRNGARAPCEHTRRAPRCPLRVSSTSTPAHAVAARHCAGLYESERLAAVSLPAPARPIGRTAHLWPLVALSRNPISHSILPTALLAARYSMAYYPRCSRPFVLPPWIDACGVRWIDRWHPHFRVGLLAIGLGLDCCGIGLRVDVWFGRSIHGCSRILVAVVFSALLESRETPRNVCQL